MHIHIPEVTCAVQEQPLISNRDLSIVILGFFVIFFGPVLIMYRVLHTI
jgi:hypothetical protein